MSRVPRALAVGLAGLALIAAPAGAAPGSLSAVRIDGYSGEAMEPFISRDGRFLFFNTRNEPGDDTHIQFARRVTEDTFQYLGPLPGVRSAALDAVPSLAGNGTFCFISTRSYRQTLTTVYCGRFDGAKVSNVAPQTGLRAAALGLIVFDAEISADGQWMVYAEGRFSGAAAPADAHLHMARLGPLGFAPWPRGERLLAGLRGDDLEYAPALSADGSEICFTRVSGVAMFRRTGIWCARRSRLDEPFGAPTRITALDGFVEGPTLSGDGRSLYVHRKVDGRFSIWRLAR